MRKRFGRGILFLALTLGALTVVGAEPTTPFSSHSVLDLARDLAQSPFHPGPDALGSTTATYDEYRQVRFNSDRSIDVSPFLADLFPTGFLFRQAVQVFVVNQNQARELKPGPEWFTGAPQGAVPKFSGLKLRYPINRPGVWDEFLVIQGASYFRAVSAGASYGLSARLLSVGTGDDPEEFPAVTALWMVPPSQPDGEFVVWALIDSPSLTAAARIQVEAGSDITMDVQLTIYPRRRVTNWGIAPLTSMFLLDSTRRHELQDYRNAVHDSDGLWFLNSSHEGVWRPLANPTSIQISSFSSVAPARFGLVQRARTLSDYQDWEARYDLRPNLLVEPRGDWGPGRLTLVELPSDSETNDNIVAYFRPDHALVPGQAETFSYGLTWTRKDPENDLASVVATRLGRSFDQKRPLFALDFSAPSAAEGPFTWDVWASSGTVVNPVLHASPDGKTWRGTFELEGLSPGQVPELSARIVGTSGPVSETWLHRVLP